MNEVISVNQTPIPVIPPARRTIVKSRPSSDSGWTSRKPTAVMVITVMYKGVLPRPPLYNYIADRPNDRQHNEIGDRTQETGDENAHRSMTSPGEADLNAREPLLQEARQDAGFRPIIYLTLCSASLTVVLTDACQSRYGPSWVPNTVRDRPDTQKPDRSWRKASVGREVKRHYPLLRSNK